MDISGKLNGLDLFSGIGGIGQALSPWVKTRAYCERERFAQAILLSRMARGELDAAPIWDDVTTLTGHSLEIIGAAEIDIIFGGFPCQDISVAGKQAGVGEGTRSGLFREICRLAGELRPSYIFLENVSAITFRGGLDVVGALAESGYDARWTTLSAADVGATHKRDRWWCLATRRGVRLAQARHIGGRDQRQLLRIEGEAERPAPTASPAGSGAPLENKERNVGLADASGRGREPKRDSLQRGRIGGGPQPELDGDKGMAHTSGSRAESNIGRLRQRLSGTSRGKASNKKDGNSGVGLADAEGGRLQGIGAGGRQGSHLHDGEGLPRCDSDGLGGTEGGVDLVDSTGERPRKSGDPNSEREIRDGQFARPSRPPYPNDPRWAEIIERWPEVKPAVCGVDAGLPNRNNRIRALGNSVDVICAREAFKILTGLS